MAGRRFVFDPPDRFVVGATGEPGRRTFFLQARLGPATLSVALEKVQLALLAERIGQLLEELDRRGVEMPPPARRSDAGPDTTLEEPVVEAFRVGSMAITYDPERRDVTFDARALDEQVVRERRRRARAEETDEGAHAPEGEEGAEADEDAGGGSSTGETGFDADTFAVDDEADLIRVRVTLGHARALAEDAMTVVAAGRPPCPLCGEPLDPQGHICLRRNGYLM